MHSEIPLKRAYNAKTFLREDGSYQAEFHSKWIHYMTEEGTWADIDCELTETEDGFEVTDAPFYFEAPLFADEEAYFEVNCQYDIFKKERIKEEAVARYMKCMVTAHVKGELFDLNGNGRVDSVIYRNAIPHLSADLIYFVEHGRAPRLKQLIRFNAVPDEDVQIPFRIRFTHEMKIEKIGDGYSHKFKGMRGMSFKPFHIWDSRGKKKKIKVTYERDKNVYWFTKHLPKSFFTKVGLPVYTDDTSTFFPDQNPESTSVDGDAARDGVVESISTIIAAAGTSATDSNTTFLTSGARNSGSPATTNWTLIRRAIIVFDTSSLADDVSVSAATLSVYPTAGSGATRDCEFANVYIYSGTVTTAIAASNFNSANWSGTCSTEASYTAMSTGAYYGFVLDAGGIANVSLTGLSKFGIRHREGTAGTVTSPGFTAEKTYSSADTAGTSQDPKLVVTFTSPPTAPSGLAVANASASSDLVLTWTDNSSTEDSFLVERSTDGVSGWSQIATKSANVVTHTDSLAAFDTLRYYRVRAHLNSPSLNSAYTSVASATTAPAAPTSLLSTAGAGMITLTWVDTSTTLTAVSVERKIGSGSYSVLTTVQPGVLTYVDSTTIDSNSYTYRIRNYRSSDTLYSAYATGSATLPTPGTPYGIAATAVSANDTITISWVDNSSSESNYRVERSMTGVGSWSEIAQPSANATSYTDDLSAQDTLRYYRVRAYRSSDTVYSSYSSTASAYSAPATPTALALSRTTTQGSLTWTNNSATATEYRIERSTNSAAYVQIGVSSSTSFIDGDIDPADTYSYKVRCYRSSDEVFSSYSSVVSSSGTGAIADVALYGGCIDETTGAAKIQLTWSSTNYSDGSYLIERSANGTTGWAEVETVSSTVNQYTNTGLTAGTTYYYRVSNQIAGVTQTTSTVTAIKASKGTAGDLMMDFLHKTRNFPK